MNYLLLLTALLASVASGFSPAARSSTRVGVATPSSTSLYMASEEDLVRWSRSKRGPDADDTVVELRRPLGLVLQEDENGNVFVETLAPKGNAARTGLVKEGDIVTMCSATFGNQMWSTRGVGLTRVLAAIRVRAGNTVSLVVESKSGYKKKASSTANKQIAMAAAAKQAQEKKDSLLAELEKDEGKLKKGKFLGLF